tara:strand:- start:1932 stop:2348 length:417 start_codon:yes stop_codon:yes gene_type:complete
MSNFKTDVLGNNAPIEKSLIETIGASIALSNTDSGTKYLVGTDALVITLPSTKKGVEFTIINSGADGNNIITISPAAGDAVIGSIANAAADSVSGGVDGKDIINTKSTANKGDRITLVGDGDSGWYIVDGVGIWASEA